MKQISLRMQTKLLPATIVLIAGLGLAACAAPPAASATPTNTAAVAPAPGAASTAAPAANPILKTSTGEFEIASARYVNEIHGETPGAGEKILLVTLALPGGQPLDPGSFSLEAFDKAIHDTFQGEVHLTGDDGSYTISTMAGWVGEGSDEFAFGFRVPSAAKSFQLLWPGNDLIDINPRN